MITKPCNNIFEFIFSVQNLIAFQTEFFVMVVEFFHKVNFEVIESFCKYLMLSIRQRTEILH
jgi:hypothetical protein